MTTEDIIKNEIYKALCGYNKNLKSFDDVPNDVRMEELGADSLDCFEAIMFIEDALEIQIDEQELETINFTVDEILEVIE